MEKRKFRQELDSMAVWQNGKKSQHRNNKLKSHSSELKLNFRSNFKLSRSDLIQYYLKLSEEYRELLKEHNKLVQERKDIEFQIASNFCQKDRLEELIKEVKEDKEKYEMTDT